MPLSATIHQVASPNSTTLGFHQHVSGWSWRSKLLIAVGGSGRARIVPLHHSLVLPRSSWCIAGVRHHQVRLKGLVHRQSLCRPQDACLSSGVCHALDCWPHSVCTANSATSSAHSPQAGSVIPKFSTCAGGTPSITWQAGLKTPGSMPTQA